MVFIHRSIKTRIETYWKRYKQELNNWFLYIDPLKQGLKHNYHKNGYEKTLGFYT